MKFSINSKCPCNSGKKYKKCCQIYHKGCYPKDALTLMKSRYSAFVIGEVKYIISTSTFQKDYQDLKNFSDGCDFKKLTIIEFEDIDSIDSSKEAFVTFKADIFCDGQDNSFCEKSRFVYIDGKWLYESGEIL